MSLGIEIFCPYHDEKCPHHRNWEVDGVDENGCHTIWREHECLNTTECKSVEKELVKWPN